MNFETIIVSPASNTVLSDSNIGNSQHLEVRITPSYLNYTGGGLQIEWVGRHGGDLELSGEASSNTLIGGSQDDTISGSGGNDVLKGGGGNDTLTVAKVTTRLPARPVTIR